MLFAPVPSGANDENGLLVLSFSELCTVYRHGILARNLFKRVHNKIQKPCEALSIQVVDRRAKGIFCF